MKEQSSNLSNPTNQSDLAISVDELTKFYGTIKGIEGVSFIVKKGEIHGFLGPNGAGKTTTIRILVGLMGATDGDASIFGRSAGSIESKHLIGYLPSDFGLPTHYNVGQYLDYIESLRGSAPYRVELVRRLQLDESRKTAELSRGNRQKVCIVQALMHEPQILIADEPTSGLDPLMQAEFNQYIKEYVKRGGTVFLSSHILADVQGVCEKITVIRRGTIVSSGSIDDLLSNMPRKIMVKLDKHTEIEDVAEAIGAQVGIMEIDSYPLYFEGTAKEASRKLLDIDGINDFSIPNPSLEEYFYQIYAGDDKNLPQPEV